MDFLQTIFENIAAVEALVAAVIAVITAVGALIERLRYKQVAEVAVEAIEQNDAAEVKRTISATERDMALSARRKLDKLKAKAEARRLQAMQQEGL